MAKRNKEDAEIRTLARISRFRSWPRLAALGSLISSWPILLIAWVSRLITCMKVRWFALSESGTLSRACSRIQRLCCLGLIPWDCPCLPVMLISCSIMFSAGLIRKLRICWRRLPFRLMLWGGSSVAVLIWMLRRRWLNFRLIPLLVTLKPKEDVTTQMFMTLWFCITLISRTRKRPETCVLI